MREEHIIIGEGFFKIFKCGICGFETNTEYWDTGYINHTNETNNSSLKVLLDRNNNKVTELADLSDFEQEGYTDQYHMDHIIKHRRMWIECHHKHLLEAFDAEIKKNKDKIPYRTSELKGTTLIFKTEDEWDNFYREITNLITKYDKNRTGT